MPNEILDQFTHDFHPDVRSRLKLCDLLKHKGPKQLIDGWPWHALSAAEIEALRSARHFSAWFNSFTGEADVTLIGGVSPSPLVLPVPARLAEPFRKRKHDLPFVGDAFFNLFPEQTTPVGTILRCLWPGDRVRLLWWDDAETTAILEDAGLHGDLLRLEVKRTMPDGAEDVLVFDLTRTVAAGHGRLIRPFHPGVETTLSVRRSDRTA